MCVCVGVCVRECVRVHRTMFVCERACVCVCWCVCERVCEGAQSRYRYRTCSDGIYVCVRERARETERGCVYV